jgi:curved DNA-binding protein CbpA
MSKDYYRILGVLDDAEDIVIKAAYKALAQRYHPDKWVGDKDEATRRMSDINEAYGVLSDPVKRREYDSTRDKNSYQAEPEDDELSSSVDSDWKKVTEFFPDLIEISQRLRKISNSLESSYKLTLLELKEFNRRKELADVFERHFLERYFGTNEQVLSYAKLLIVKNQRDALRAVNEAVNLLGSDVDPAVIIENVDRKWLVGEYGRKLILARQITALSAGSERLEKSIEFVSLVCGPLTKTPRLRYALHNNDFETHYFDEISIQDYASKLATQFLSGYTGSK